MKRLVTVTAVFILLSPGASVIAGGAESQVASGSPAPLPGGEKPVAELPYQRRSPILAGALSIVPGLGQVYNQQYAVGGIWFVTEASLYLAAAAYAGVFDSSKKAQLGYESIFLLAIAGGLHLLSIFDATMEAVRVNQTLDRFSLMVDPTGSAFSLAYRVDW